MKTATISAVSFSVLYALMIIFQQYVVKDNSFRDFIFWSYVTTLLLTVTYALIRNSRKLIVKSIRGWTLGALVGISASVLADSFILIGLQSAPSLNWGILSQLGVPLTFLFAVLWLSERFNISKILAILVSIVGAVLVVVQTNQKLDFGLGNLWFLSAVVFLAMANIFKSIRSAFDDDFTAQFCSLAYGRDYFGPGIVDLAYRRTCGLVDSNR